MTSPAHPDTGKRTVTPGGACISGNCNGSIGRSVTDDSHTALVHGVSMVNLNKLLLIQRRLRRGATLLEVVFAVFIVAGAALVFSALIPPAVKSEKMVASHQQAISIIQHKIDQLRGVGYGRLTYSELLDAGIIDSSPSSSPYQFTQVDQLTTFYRQATGTIAISDFDANIRRATITLTWTGAAFRQGNGSLSIDVLIARG